MLASVVCKPVGEMGFDIAVGSAQRYYGTPFPPFFLPSHLPICSVLISHSSQPSCSTSMKISSDIENTMKSIMNSYAAGTTELDFCLFYLHVLTSTFNHLQPPLPLTSHPSFPHQSSTVTSTLVSSHLISYHIILSGLGFQWGSEDRMLLS